MTERVERLTKLNDMNELPRNRRLWGVIVDIIDPSTGENMTGKNLLPAALGEWLDGGWDKLECKPNDSELKRYAADVVARHEYLNGYVVIARAIQREYRYVTDCGRLRLVRA